MTLQCGVKESGWTVVHREKYSWEGKIKVLTLDMVSVSCLPEVLLQESGKVLNVYFWCSGSQKWRFGVGRGQRECGDD